MAFFSRKKRPDKRSRKNKSSPMLDCRLTAESESSSDGGYFSDSGDYATPRRDYDERAERKEQQHRETNKTANEKAKKKTVVLCRSKKHSNLIKRRLAGLDK